MATIQAGAWFTEQVRAGYRISITTTGIANVVSHSPSAGDQTYTITSTSDPLIIQGAVDVNVQSVSGTVTTTQTQYAGAVTLPVQIMSCGIPFALLPGNGSNAGLQFTGTAGAFTLSAAIMTNSSLFLDYGYCYLPANFGGSSYPAGWYYFTMSTSTAGIVYMNQYTSGQPAHPASLTPFPVNLTGYITQTTAEVTALNGFSYPGNAMGPNGYLLTLAQVFCTSSAGTKALRARVGTAVAFNAQLTTASYGGTMMAWQNKGVNNRQKLSRPNGLGSLNSSVLAPSVDSSAIDTSVDQALKTTLQIDTNTDGAAILSVAISANYGA